MRDIKFRAWDKEKSKMQIVSCLGINFGYGFLMRPEENGDNAEGFDVGTQDNRFELMQYTGLKDQNGKEIYEGDIVKDDEGNKVVKYGEWNCGECSWVYGYDFGNYKSDEKEVIGNIYENPELKEVR